MISTEGSQCMMGGGKVLSAKQHHLSQELRCCHKVDSPSVVVKLATKESRALKG